MDRLRLVLVTALVAAVATGAMAAYPQPASAQAFGRPEGRGPGFEDGPGLPAMLRNAGLTEVQHSQVRQIVANHRLQFESLIKQLHVAREALDAKLHSPGPLAAADLDPLIRQIDTLRSQLTQEGLRVTLEIRAILTPEQLAKADQTRRRLAELRKEMRGLLQGR